MPAPKGPFIGVTQNRRTWNARLYIGRVAHDVGPWPTAEEAAIARDRAILYFGVDKPLVLPAASKRLGPASPDDLARLGWEKCGDLIKRHMGWRSKAAAARAAATRAPKQRERKPSGASTSHGVTREPDGRYVVTIFVHRRQMQLGYFTKADEAALARDRAVLHFGLDLPLGRPRKAASLGRLTAEELGALRLGKPPAVRPWRRLDTSSLYRGVRREEDRWLARFGGESCGRFDREEDAAVAHDRVALFVYGSGAALNFPSRRSKPASAKEMRAWGRKLAKQKTTSRYVGVSYDPGHQIQPWVAYAPDHTFVGAWEAEREAAIARDRAVLYLNVETELSFPEQARALGPASPEALRRDARKQYKRHKTSQYRGVFWETRSQRWIARITHQGVVRQLGAYTEETRAARAYDDAAVMIHGGGAKLNFKEQGRR